jgi:NADPH:quinone reductase-like Zn-dependent oxidoreductase
MRQVIARRAGGPEVLEVVEVEEPVAGPGEVVVRAEAIGVNFADVWVRLGADGEPPFAPGIEVAGVVAAVGEGVEQPRVGERVAATPYETRAAYAELVRAPAALAFPVPDRLESVEAAALPLNYLTAYAAIEQAARPRAGERVLVHAAAGGVGLAAVQLARRHGAELYATASGSKHTALAEEGVTHAVDYRQEDWVEAVRRLTGDGVDAVVDGVGEDAFRRSLEVLRFGGRVVAYGYTSGVTGPDAPPPDLERALGGDVPLLELLSEARSLMGVHMGAPADTLQTWWRDVLAWHEAGEIRPRIDSVLALEDAAEAHARLHARANVGKIVLVP